MTAYITAMVAAATAQCATVAPRALGPPQDRSSSSLEAPAAQNGYQMALAATNTRIRAAAFATVAQSSSITPIPGPRSVSVSMCGTGSGGPDGHAARGRTSDTS